MKGGKRQNGHNIHAHMRSDWTLRGAGDVDGDRIDDIIWQYKNGQAAYWKMTKVLTYAHETGPEDDSASTVIDMLMVYDINPRYIFNEDHVPRIMYLYVKRLCRKLIS